MLSGVFFTLGGLAIACSVGWFLLTSLAVGMSDSPSETMGAYNKVCLAGLAVGIVFLFAGWYTL